MPINSCTNRFVCKRTMSGLEQVFSLCLLYREKGVTCNYSCKKAVSSEKVLRSLSTTRFDYQLDNTYFAVYDAVENIMHFMPKFRISRTTCL